MRHKTHILRFLVISFLFILSACSSKAPGGKDQSDAEKLWGSERVCLPCHLFQQPIARRHHYRCDTCHKGNPWADNKEEAHYGLIKAPQNPENIGLTCDKCHRRVLGRDMPYNAEFIKDVIVSHQRQEGESLEWQE
ncbi:MAG: hypothetical protein KDK51_07590 [Deltaproteobacteria bacterium]|nr:hypothetical protein [Deltaproteobacteria bacterium]